MEKDNRDIREKEQFDKVVDAAAAGIKSGITGTALVALACSGVPVAAGLGAACLVGSVVSCMWDNVSDN